MLTDTDLAKIGKIVDDTIESKLEQKLDSKLKPIHQELKKLRKNQDLIVRSFDQLTSRHHKRITRLEDHTGIGRIAD